MSSVSKLPLPSGRLVLFLICLEHGSVSTVSLLLEVALSQSIIEHPVRVLLLEDTRCFASIAERPPDTTYIFLTSS